MLIVKAIISTYCTLTFFVHEFVLEIKSKGENYRNIKFSKMFTKMLEDSTTIYTVYKNGIKKPMRYAKKGFFFKTNLLTNTVE
jgi:hypothetical protein